MKKYVVFALIAVLASCAESVKPDPAKIVKMQAEDMVALMQKNDYEGMVIYTYPKMLDAFGGKTAMVESLENERRQMEAQGGSITKISIGEPSEIITEGKEVQCTLPETIALAFPGNRLESIRTLIAVSQNKGGNWYFIDAGEDPEQMRQAFPNLSSRLKFEKPGPPVRYPTFRN